jgi:SAM-dependent methyltransferase
VRGDNAPVSGPDPDFWQQRFERREAPWDRGGPGPQIAVWLSGGMLAPGQRVLVPGCGSGHDVLALTQAGCAVTALDIAPAAIGLTAGRLATAGLSAETVQADALQWRPQQPFDAVYEQTCWCALHPDRWTEYALQLQRWVRPGGRLLLLAMQCRRDSASHGRIEGPPYHMDIHAVRALAPVSVWDWPPPPYPGVPHPRGWTELAVVLTRR